jgi:hypothetical protein
MLSGVWGAQEEVQRAVELSECQMSAGARAGGAGPKARGCGWCGRSLWSRDCVSRWSRQRKTAEARSPTTLGKASLIPPLLGGLRCRCWSEPACSERWIGWVPQRTAAPSGWKSEAMRMVLGTLSRACCGCCAPGRPAVGLTQASFPPDPAPTNRGASAAALGQAGSFPPAACRCKARQDELEGLVLELQDQREQQAHRAQVGGGGGSRGRGSCRTRGSSTPIGTSWVAAAPPATAAAAPAGLQGPGGWQQQQHHQGKGHASQSPAGSFRGRPALHPPPLQTAEARAAHAQRKMAAAEAKLEAATGLGNDGMGPSAERLIVSTTQRVRCAAEL